MVPLMKSELRQLDTTWVYPRGYFSIVLFYQERALWLSIKGYMERPPKHLDICFSPDELQAYNRILLWEPKFKVYICRSWFLDTINYKDFFTEEDIQREFTVPRNELSNS